MKNTFLMKRILVIATLAVASHCTAYANVSYLNYGARRYVPATCYFSSPDIAAEEMPFLSSYTFCAANPVNIIDPTGNINIYINGFHMGKDGGKSQYWEGVDFLINSLTHDYNSFYVDGSVGGIYNTAIVKVLYRIANNEKIRLKDLQSNFSWDYRNAQGYRQGKIDAEKIIEKSISTNTPIRIITHSMGAAFGKGYTLALKQFIDKNQLNDEVSIDLVLDIAAYQGTNKNAVEGVHTVSISHSNDPLSRSIKENNAINIISRYKGTFLYWELYIKSDFRAHFIENFREDIYDFFSQQQ